MTELDREFVVISEILKKNNKSLPNMEQGVGSLNISKRLLVPGKEANRAFNKCFLIISRQIAIHRKLLTFVRIKEIRRLPYRPCMRLGLLILRDLAYSEKYT